MTTIFSLYRQHGFLISLVVFMGLIALSVALHALSSSHRRMVQVVQAMWGTSALVFILVMTMTPCTPGAATGLASLQIADLISHFTQPQTSGFHWPDWHDPIGNLLMMMPLATALALTWTKSRTILATFGLSIAIEITQHFYGHGRTAQYSDVLLNTLGGVCGVGLAMLCTFLAGKLPGANSGQTVVNPATAQPSEG